MKVNHKNLHFIRLTLMLGVIGAMFYVYFLIPGSADFGPITAAVIAEERSPAQDAIVFSLSTLFGVLIAASVIVLMLYRNEKIRKLL